MDIQDRLVIKNIANYFCVNLNEVISSRKAKIVLCKFVIYYVLTALGNSTTTVGKIVKKDHTTILYGIKKVKEDKELKKIASIFIYKALDNNYKPNNIQQLNWLAKVKHEQYQANLKKSVEELILLKKTYNEIDYSITDCMLSEKKRVENVMKALCKTEDDAKKIIENALILGHKKIPNYKANITQKIIM